MLRRRPITILGGFLTGVVLAAAAHAADWQSAARQCGEEIEEQAGCTTACINRLWPEVARCTNERLGHLFAQNRLEACIREVQKARVRARACELCGDPLETTFDCVEGE